MSLLGQCHLDLKRHHHFRRNAPLHNASNQHLFMAVLILKANMRLYKAPLSSIVKALICQIADQY